MIKGIPWNVLKEKKNDPKFDFKGFVDSLSTNDLEKMLDCMEENEAMEGRIIEAVELIGLVPTLIK